MYPLGTYFYRTSIVDRRGALTSVLNMNKILTYLYCACFVFCGDNFEFLMRGLLVRGLEPKLLRSGTGGKIPRRLRVISVILVPGLALADRVCEGSPLG